MTELLEQIARFQKIKEITGCYDVGGYNRHYHTSCLKQNLIEHMKQEIRKMEEVVKHYECEEN